MKIEFLTRIRGYFLPCVLLGVWWAAFALNASHSPLLVSPAAVWARGVSQLTSGELWGALSASLWRDVQGFLIGTSTGVLFGSLLGFSRWFEKLVGPSFHTIKQVSLFAWIPLLSVWFGLGESAKIAFVALAAFFPVTLNTFEGLRSVPREFIEMARVFDYRPLQVWRRVILPSAAPSIFAGIHLALIYSWLATLGAEYLLVSGKGIGNTLIDGREHFWMDLVIFGVLVIGCVGYALNHLLSLAERRLLAWRHQTLAQY